jgi:hypothetical protein
MTEVFFEDKAAARHVKTRMESYFRAQRISSIASIKNDGKTLVVDGRYLRMVLGSIPLGPNIE